MATALNPDGTPKSLMQQAAEAMAAANASPTGATGMAVTNTAVAQPPNSGVQITPTLNTFDESKGVEGRVASITAKDSPLMQLAKTRGTQLAAQRGLTNSTLAGEAEQNSVLAAATPIATADASLYQQAGLANQTAENAAKTSSAQLTESGRQADQASALQIRQLDQQKEQFAASLGMTAKDLELRRDTLTEQQRQNLDQINLQRQQLTQQQSQFDVTQTSNQANFAAELAQRQTIATLSSETQLAVANLSEANKALIQGNLNISNAWGSMMQNIQAIQNNANLDGPAKQQLVQNALDAFASYSKFWQKVNGGTIDIAPLLDFGTVVPGTGTSPGAAPNAGAGSVPGAGVAPGAGNAPTPTAPGGLFDWEDWERNRTAGGGG